MAHTISIVRPALNDLLKFLDAGIQDVSTSISIVHDLIEISPAGDENDKHM